MTIPSGPEPDLVECRLVTVLLMTIALGAVAQLVLWWVDIPVPEFW